MLLDEGVPLNHDRHGLIKVGVGVIEGWVARAELDGRAIGSVFLNDRAIDIKLLSTSNPVNDPTDLENIFIPKTQPQQAPAGTTIKVGDAPQAQAAPPAVRVVPQAVEQGPSDQQIADDISKQLHARKEAGLLKGFGLRLHVKDGAIRLSGRVSKMSDRQMVGELARATYGVTQVVNELELTSPKGSQPVRVAIATGAPAQLPVVTDNQIAMMISGELKAKKENGTLTNFSLQMTVKDGKVWLQGYVPSRKQREMAIAAAEAIPGVAEVINEIDIQLPITRDIAAMMPQVLRPQGPLNAPNLAQVPVAMAGALAAAPAAMMAAAPGQGPGSTTLATSIGPTRSRQHRIMSAPPARPFLPRKMPLTRQSSRCRESCCCTSWLLGRCRVRRYERRYYP